MNFSALVEQELLPAFVAAGFRPLPPGETGQLLVSPTAVVFEVVLDPRDGTDLTFLDRDRKAQWTRYPMVLFLARRADKARLVRPAIPQGRLDDTRLRAELSNIRLLLEAVGGDVLAGDRRWLREFPWPSTPLPAALGRELDRTLAQAS